MPTPTSGCPRSDLMDVGIVVSASEQLIPKVALAADGHAWVTWYSLENGNSNVRAQRLDRDGQPTLTAGGLLVSDKPSGSWVADYSLAVDSEGAAIVAVNDVRNGNFDLSAYKLTADGGAAWGRDGVSLSQSRDGDYFPRLTLSQDGEAVVVWDRLAADGTDTVVVQRVSRDGRALWGDGVVVTGTHAASAQWGWVAPADGANVVLVWIEANDDLAGPRYVLARKLDAHGQPVWPADVVLADGQLLPNYVKPVLAADGDGGVFVAWTAGEFLLKTVVQHLDKDGRLTMSPGGVPVSLSQSTNQVAPVLAYVPAAQELVVVWSERNSGQSQRGLRAQRLTASGTKRWGDNGIELVALSSSGPDVGGMFAAADGVLLVYGEPTSPNAVTMRILGARLALVNAPAWSPVLLSGRVSQKEPPSLGGTPDCGAWVVWQDKDADAGDIRGSFLTAQ